MRKSISTVVVFALTLVIAGSARSQFEPGTFILRPEFGLGIANSIGLTFGGSMVYNISERLAIGPAFHYSTAGRQWEIGGDNLTLKTQDSNSMAVAGRIYYLLSPGSDYPWYVNAGVGLVYFGSVSEYEDGDKIIVLVDNQNQEMEIKSAMRIAGNLGTGSMFPVADNIRLVIDANSYIGSHGDIEGEVTGQDVDVSNLFEGGTFWILHTTIGLNFLF